MLASGAGGGSAVAGVGMLQVGTLIEVFWPGERDWFGGRVGAGGSGEGVTVIEYFDGNPVREEVFLEGEPRGPGGHDDRLFRRNGGRQTTVEAVGSWSREVEKGLLMGWRRLPQGDGGGGGGEVVGVGDVGVGGEAWPLGWVVRGGVEEPHLSLRLEVSGGAFGGVRGAVVCPVDGCTVGRLASRRALTGHFRRSHPDASNHLLSVAGLTRCPEASCGALLAETGLRQHRSRGGGCAAGVAQRCEPVRVEGEGGGRDGRQRGSDFPSLMVPKRLRGLFTECAMVALARMRVDPEDLARGVQAVLIGPALGAPAGAGGSSCDAGEERVLRDAVRRVKAGQLGKAAKRLELAKLAPATEETLRRLEQLHPAGTGRRREVEGDRRRELQEQALELDGRVFDDVMRNPSCCGLCPGGRAGLREWLAGARLVAVLKDDLGVNVRPIACGEVLRKLVAKIGVAVKGGADLGVHTVQAALDQHPEWVCVKVDAKNAFTAVHREAVFEAIERDFPELWAWTNLCYGVEANLGFRLGGVDGSVMRFVKSREGAQQVVLGRAATGAAYDTYVEEAVAVSLHIQPAKSAAYSPEGDPGFFAEEMPGARGELDFINVLGVPVGNAEAVSAEMLRKSLQAAMQKVKEAMGDIEEAREAEQHLPSQLAPFGVEVYGGLGPAAVAFLKRTQRRFSGRRYLAEDAAEEDEVDEEGDERGRGMTSGARRFHGVEEAVGGEGDGGEGGGVERGVGVRNGGGGSGARG
ncbi:hypothetical protein CYMTET_8793 [Cymbomonas tetramitiformis]|uniref:Uncharacterized protein n=1 Tax=Cymbomonas tetramitiformis TaxID=36881 RepID=A0AAE0GSA0_9CHLO|nr:hypothetical protein CYMTET_8793 [Cymbomonas tetramitiformis]